jgi:hypothetical protein
MIIRQVLSRVFLTTACTAVIAMLAACASPGGASRSAASDSSGTSSTATSGSSGGYTAPLGLGNAQSECDAGRVQSMIGTTLSASTQQQAVQSSGSKKARVLKPGEVMTMEYDPTRINLIVDQQNKLTALRCG